MKKIWQMIFAIYMLTTSAYAGLGNNISADTWVDSMYRKLTVAERIGQLIDFRVEPTSENIVGIIDDITNNHVGSVTIIGGDAEASVLLINSLQEHMKVPVFVSVDVQKSLNLPFTSPTHLPKTSTFIKANDSLLLSSSIDQISGIYRKLGINGSLHSLHEMVISDDGLTIKSGLQDELPSYFQSINNQLQKNQIVSNTDFHFRFSNDFISSPKAMHSWNVSSWKDKASELGRYWNSNNLSKSILTIKSLPEFPENDAVHFNKKIVNPLLWKYLQYGGVLSADFDAIKKNQYSNSHAEIVRSLIKIGSDKIVVSSDIDEVYAALMNGLDNRYFKQNEIKGKVKRILALKYQSGLTKGAIINDAHINEKLNDPFLDKLSYQVYIKALKCQQSDDLTIPYKHLPSTNFASLSLGYSELKTFQETLDKYAPFVHYVLPDVAFDPYDLDILKEQLVRFDNVIIGLHTDGLMELDHATLSFLVYLNSKTNVVMVFLGKEVNLKELAGFKNRIIAQEDNLFTQQIAAQFVFGALDTNTNRLGYSPPEMQRMNSLALRKIDEIVEEAISIGATPGCQVLVARNGSVVFEKGYGYYTYDSIMPVDTRTIYDLASITKVAATTQAIMKLEEDGLIHLDSTLGAYLPELQESNKGSLVISDILAHQSGLKAFYPFWRNTIEDEDKTLHYYKDKPSNDFSNTVAYGMFAAEELKDSLWHWTVDTNLRKKALYRPYDYKYSDLGFYLLQVLVERVAEMPLDVFLDAAFYQPLGMSTMGFNPLCKFPLKRITPTERDTDFRHVLVWGTVHDQIAAMKGGVSGHAGLFSNSHDIAKIMQMHLQDGNYGGRQYLEKQTVKKYASQQHKRSRRGLGWDMPEKGDEYNPASRYSSFKAFGHSGFTGTVVWADPTFDLIYVFLSNRIYPDSNNGKLVDLNIRKRIHNVIYESIWNYEKFYN